VYGVGQELHESALEKTNANAERLLMGGLAMGAFGLGVGMAIPGLNRAVQRGSRDLVEGTRRVLGNVVDGPVSRDVAEVLSTGDANLAEAWLRANTVDSDVASRLVSQMRKNPARVHDVLTRGKQIDDELANLLHSDLRSINQALGDARRSVQ
jgi:hypothetical protein